MHFLWSKEVTSVLLSPAVGKALVLVEVVVLVKARTGLVAFAVNTWL